MVHSPPPRALEKTPLFHFLYFLFKEHQTPLKSMHISPFVTSVIFGRISKSLKIVPRPPPRALEKTPLFLFLFFWFKVHQTPLKCMHISSFVPSVIFGSITKSLKMVPSQPPLALEKTPLPGDFDYVNLGSQRC